MANGTPSQPKKWFSENSQRIWRNAMAMKQQGAPDEDIEEYLIASGAQRTDERPGVIGAAENFGRGALLGTAQGTTSLVGAAGFLTRPIGGRALEDWATQKSREVERFYDPQGMAGAAGQAVGRIASEVAQAGLMAGPAAKLVSGVPRLGPAVTQALTKGTRLQRAGASAALSAPIDIVQGVKSETPILLPEATGRLGSIAEGMLLSGVAGGLRAPEKPPVQQPLGTRRPQEAGRTVVDQRLATIERPPVAAAEPAALPTAGARLAAAPEIPALPGAPRQLAAPAVEAPPVAPAAAAEPVAPAARAAEAAAEREMIEAGSRPSRMEEPLEELAKRVPKIPPSAKRLRTVDDEKLSDMWAYYSRRLQDDIMKAGRFYDEQELIDFISLSTTSAKEKGGKLGYAGAKRMMGTAEEARKAKRLTEEQLGWLEERNISLDDYREMMAALDRVKSAEKTFGRIDAEASRRGLDVFGAEDVSFDFGANRPGFARMQALTTLAGAGAGATAGGLLGTDRETRIAGAISGGLLGAGLGFVGGRALDAAAPQGPRGSSPDIQEVNRTINIGERPKGTKPWLSWSERFRTDWISQNFPLEKAAFEAAGKAGKEAITEEIAKAQGAGQAAKQYLLDNVQPAIEAARGKLDDVRALLKARRDLNLRQRELGVEVLDPQGRVIFTGNRAQVESMLRGQDPRQLELGMPAGYTIRPVRGAAKSDIPDDVLERAIADAEKDPAVKNAADTINRVYRDLLTKRYQAGIIDTDTYNNILNSEDFYTPFVREFVDDIAATGGAGGKRWIQTATGIRRMDRTQMANAQTADPLEVLMSSVERTFNDVGRQNVQNVLATFVDLERIPNLIRRVEGRPTPGKLTFTQMRGGKPVQYEVLDKDLYEAIAGQGPRSIGTMYLLGTYAARALRAGVTIRPIFALFNAMRDITMSGIQRPDTRRAVREMMLGVTGGAVSGAATAEEGERLKGMLIGAGAGAGLGAYARPLAQTMVALKNVVGNDEVYKNWLRRGGSTEGFYVRNASDAREFLERMERDGSIRDIVNPGNIWKALTYVGNVAEQSTRLAAYKQLRELGATEAQAILGSQDRTLRFAERGRQGAKVADIAAFWNPRVQGMDKLVRMLKDPKTWGMGAAMITAPTLALWNVNKDNPEYWERPVWERNMFWLIPKGGEPDEYGKVGFYRIPKPFEIGLLFASLPERFLDAAAQSGVDLKAFDTGDTAAPLVAEPGRAIRETVGTALSEAATGLLPIPTIGMVPGQMAVNYDIFRDRPIVSRKDLPSAQQVTPESSAIARVLAERGISPQMTDFAIRGVFGGAGSDISNIIDRAVAAAGGAAPEQKPLRLRPKQLVTQTYSSTEAETSARERLNRLEAIHRGYLRDVATGNPDRINRYVEENRDDLNAWSNLSRAKTELDRLAAERRAVISNQRVPQDIRQSVLSRVRRESDKISRDILSYGMNR